MKVYYVHIWFMLSDSNVLNYETGLFNLTGNSSIAISLMEDYLKEQHGDVNVHVKRVEVETLNINHYYCG
jgi:hypothetical protein